MSQAQDKSDDPLASIKGRLNALGFELTPLRKLVLSLLVEAKAPVKAYDLLEAARSHGQRLTAASVYRVLDFFRDRGLVHRVNALNAFVVCNDDEPTGGHHPLIVVCPDCGKTTEINDGTLTENLLAGLNALGHTVKMVSVEVHGLCRGCAGK
ncbi:MAG: transcriptional repressor [Deltaproteobacteria bacterium]|jgi:Fur family zinc uptake transcriptional regulator|nr:transcriptional repressor [Deltaproteobacteria bacterium]